jgi:hypothetical protein
MICNPQNGIRLKLFSTGREFVSVHPIVSSGRGFVSTAPVVSSGCGFVSTAPEVSSGREFVSTDRARFLYPNHALLWHMDEKTEELRDIFMDVTDEETVTESQEELRGSVADSGDSDEERLTATVEEMVDKFEFETDLDVETLSEVVMRFYDGDDDETIADALSLSTEVVFYARMDTHLIRDEDPDGVTAPEEVWDEIRARNDDAIETLASDLDYELEEIERIRAVTQANARSRRVSQRFRTTFEECLTDINLSTQLAVDTQRDGLDDATEDAEVDVEF